jgi:hypothetical protein
MPRASSCGRTWTICCSGRSAGDDLAVAASYDDVLAKARAEVEKRLKITIPLPKLTF